MCLLYRGKLIAEESAGIDPGQMPLAVQVGPWLLSHAGFHPDHTLGRTPAQLLEAARRAKVRALQSISSALLVGSPARGFPRLPIAPGVTWLDFSEEFQPVDGLHQIVGHTSTRGTVRGRHLNAQGRIDETEIFHVMQVSAASPLPQPGPQWRSVNWCLDCLDEMVGLLDESGLHLLPSH